MMRLLGWWRYLPPRFMIAGGILAVSLISLWWWSPKHEQGKGEVVVQADETAGVTPRHAVSSGRPASANLEFDPAEVVLCGNTLVNYETGKILAKEWLKGFGKSPPPIAKVFPKERLVIVRGRHGVFHVFDFSGKQKPSLRADGAGIGVAAFTSDLRKVVFVRNGDLWRGSVDWQHSKVTEPVKLTDTGYFRDSTFQNRWMWHHDDLLVSSLGKVLKVNMEEGTVVPVPNNLGRLAAGMSPNGDFVLLSLDYSHLGILDLETGELKKHRVGKKVLGFFWLDENRAIVRIGQKYLAKYDHSAGELGEVEPFGEVIRGLAGLSPNGKSFLLVGYSGIHIVDSNTGEKVKLDLFFDRGEWVSEDTLLCSNSQDDSEKRGVWLVKRDGQMERILNRPIDRNSASSSGGAAIAQVPGGAVFVSEGNLWRYDPDTHEIVKAAHDARLEPILQTLSVANW